MSYRILFLGDVMGKPGRKAVVEGLPSLLETHQPLFTIINGENSAAGMGINPDIADDLFRVGADAITLGNHAFNKREISAYLEKGRPIIRPHNYPPGVPGKGVCSLVKDGVTLNVINLCGRVFMDGFDDPFRSINDLLPNLTGHVFIDFHAEATSEKVAFGWHVDGRVSAVVGTHTHVQTADNQVLPEGTAYITDAGMCGPHNGVIGMDREIVLGRFRTGMPARFEVADGPGILHGVIIDVERASGRATRIERIQFHT